MRPLRRKRQNDDRDGAEPLSPVRAIGARDFELAACALLCSGSRGWSTASRICAAMAKLAFADDDAPPPAAALVRRLSGRLDAVLCGHPVFRQAVPSHHDCGSKDGASANTDRRCQLASTAEAGRAADLTSKISLRREGTEYAEQDPD